MKETNLHFHNPLVLWKTLDSGSHSGLCLFLAIPFALPNIIPNIGTPFPFIYVFPQKFLNILKLKLRLSYPHQIFKIGPTNFHRFSRHGSWCLHLMSSPAPWRPAIAPDRLGATLCPASEPASRCRWSWTGLAELCPRFLWAFMSQLLDKNTKKSWDIWNDVPFVWSCRRFLNFASSNWPCAWWFWMRSNEFTSFPLYLGK